MTAHGWRRLHKILAAAWLLAIVPTVLWWAESILWVGLMSCWANAAGHFAAYQGARAEENSES
jgi:hypothetical protein